MKGKLIGLVLLLLVLSVVTSEAAVVIFQENFDGATPPGLPTGWAQVDVSGDTGEWATATATVHPSGQSPHSAPNLVYFNSYSASSGSSTRLYYQNPIYLPNFSGLTLSFWMFHDEQYIDEDRLQVQVSTDGNNWQDIGIPFYRYDGTTGWKKHEVDLSAYAGQNIYIGFLGISAYGNDIHVDDIEISFNLQGPIEAYGFNVYPGDSLLYWQDILSPSNAQNIASGYPSFYAGADFLNCDFSKLYAIHYSTNNFVTINTSNGETTEIATVTPPSGYSWTGLTASRDGKIYLSASTCSDSKLFEINPSNGQLTEIGTITNGPCIIDIAKYPSGDYIYGVDIANDSLIRIDPSNAQGTVVGSLSVNATYAQGLDFDDETGILFWASWTFNTFDGRLRVIDINSGKSYEIGQFPDGAEIDGFAIKKCSGLLNYTLTINRTGVGMITSTPAGITCGADCTEVYTVGTTVTLTAQGIGSTFTGWGGDCSSCGSNLTCQIVMNSNKTCTATFEELPPPPSIRYLKVTKTGVGTGTVTSTPEGISCGADCSGNYEENTEVTLKVQLDEGSTFKGWGEDCASCGKNTECKVVMTRDKFCTAEFGKIACYFFSDVPCDHWAAEPIDAIYQRGITTGYPDGTYRPDELVTREQMAAFIVRALYGEEFEYPRIPIFSDVGVSDWSWKYIQKAKEIGVTKGCVQDDPGTIWENEAKYCPKDVVTREQMAAMLLRAMGVSAGSCSGGVFGDVNSLVTTEEFCGYIEELSRRGITKGCVQSPPMYCPKEGVTRAQMAVFLWRTFLGGR